jgi:hypothetical protein
MTDGSTEVKVIEINRSLLNGGLVLVAVGSVLCMTGGLAAMAAVVGAARSRVRQWDDPPSAKARRRYAQARSAAVAGAQGWKQNGDQPAGDIAAGTVES